jgi:uncharacterized protein YbjT (DUF2867 family)
MSPTVLVTAASGKTGRHVVTNLRERGVRVRAGSRTPGAAADESVTPVRFDLNDLSSFDGAIDGIDAIYLVAVADTGDAAPLVAPLLDRLESAGVRVVLLSAMGAEQAPDYGLGRIERMLAERDLDWTVLAPNWFAQNFDQSFFLPMIRNGALRVPAGQGPVSFIDTRDIAAAAAATLVEDGHAGQRYALTGPDALTFDGVARVISEVSGRPVDYIDVTPDEMREVLRSVGMDDGYVGVMLGLFEAIRAGYAATVTDAVEQLTGRAATSFGEYAKDHASAWRA